MNDRILGIYFLLHLLEIDICNFCNHIVPLIENEFQNDLWYEQESAHHLIMQPTTIFARLPDLISLDFFLWEYLKSRNYTSKPINLKDLKEQIWFQIQRFTVQTLNNVQKEWLACFPEPPFTVWHCEWWTSVVVSILCWGISFLFYK